MQSKIPDRLDITNFILEIGRIIDGISPRTRGHHLRVAYMAVQIGTVLGLDESKIKQIFAASCLHGIGCFNLEERLTALRPDVDTTLYRQRAHAFLARLRFLKPSADIIARKPDTLSSDTAYSSRILKLAEQMDILLNSCTGDYEFSGGCQEVRETLDRFLKNEASKDFPPEILSAVKEATEPDAFWFGLEHESPQINGSFSSAWTITWEEFKEFARILSEVIDWRSKFTVTHSASVRSTAVTLAEELGLTADEVLLLSVAADLHDLGKLGIPLEILVKPGTLTSGEIYVMRKHAYFTHVALSRLEKISPAHLWASHHHERLSGDGYPFRLKASEISTGARIIAVSDVYTALTEPRPYRPAVSASEAVSVVRDMVAEGKLCPDVSDRLTQSIKTVEEARAEAIKETMERYTKWKEELNE